MTELRFAQPTAASIASSSSVGQVGSRCTDKCVEKSADLSVDIHVDRRADMRTDFRLDRLAKASALEGSLRGELARALDGDATDLPAFESFLKLVTSMNYVVVSLFLLIVISYSDSLDLLKAFAVFFELPLLVFVVAARFLRGKP